MLRIRFIPTLLLKDASLVKTVNFSNHKYVGDPVNTVRIFNELEVDELVFLDIDASRLGRGPNFDILESIASECFMPLSYGGGLRDMTSVKNVMDIGFEKVIFNSITHEDLSFVERVAENYGTQAVVASIDVKTNIWGRSDVWTLSATKNTKKNPVEWAKKLEQSGVGEILLTSVDREGTWRGFDTDLTRAVAEAVNVPVVAHGGGGSVDDIARVIEIGRASSVALGSMVVYQKKGMGVLINFPDSAALDSIRTRGVT
jgi:cyclase